MKSLKKARDATLLLGFAAALLVQKTETADFTRRENARPFRIFSDEKDPGLGAVNVFCGGYMAQPGNLQDPKFLESLRADVGNEATPLFQWFLDHARAIAGVVVAVVVVIAALGIWKWHSAKQREQAHFDLGLAIVTQKGEERLKTLEALSKSAPDSMAGAIFLESALTAQEMEKDAQAAGLWDNAAQRMTGPLSSIARLAAAGALLDAGKGADAVAMLERLATTVEKPLIPLVRLQFAAAAERTGDFERAATAYELLAKETFEIGADANFYRAQAERMRAKIPGGKKE